MVALYFAVVCSSNMNRSMEAHAYLAKKGLRVRSFGTGDKVKLPGRAQDHPNCYEFGTPYDYIYNDLVKQNKAYYTNNGLLNMLHRNRKLKECPEKLQDSLERFNVIITCEERIYDQVIDWMAFNRAGNQPVHIVNVEIQDNFEEALIGSFAIYDVACKLVECNNLNMDMEQMLERFETKTKHTLLHCVMFY